MKDPIFHKFVVFSVVNKDDTVIEKNVQCNNCGVIHRIYDICKSDIVHGKEEMKTLISKKDIKLMVPSKLADILESYNADLASWEQANFIVRNKKWNSQIFLSRDETDIEETAKVLRIIDRDDYLIDLETSQKFIGDFDDDDF